MAREYFCAYHSYLKSVEPLNDAECGRLFRSCLEYSMTGAEPELRGNEKFVWPMIQQQIDRDREKYNAFCEKQRGNIQKRWDTTVYGGKSGIPDDTKHTKTKAKEKEKEISANADTHPVVPPTDFAPPDKPEKHKYGEYGWVRLTDAERERLDADLGAEEAQRCIRYIDEAAQSSGNKNKWRDWNLVIRRCSRERWGAHAAGASAGTARRGTPYAQHEVGDLSHLCVDLDGGGA